MLCDVGNLWGVSRPCKFGYNGGSVGWDAKPERVRDVSVR